jgi:hypothetical protein
MTVTTDQTAPAHTPQRPDECPDVERHARPQRQGDYRSRRRYKCPSCGFWCLLAPPAPAATRAPESDEVPLLICADCGEEFFSGQSCVCSEPAMTEAEQRHAEARRLHPDCEECRIGKGYIIPGPRHSSVHRGHCSCDGCF